MDGVWYHTIVLSCVLIVWDSEVRALGNASAADSTTVSDSTALRIRNSGSIQLNCSQMSSYDYLSGERTSVDITTALRFSSMVERSKFRANVSTQATLGLRSETMMVMLPAQVQGGAPTTVSETRLLPTDNELRAECRCSYALGWLIDPYLGATCKTSITESFIRMGSLLQRTASLWDPVCSTQSCGFNLSKPLPGGMISIRAAALLEQIRSVSNTTLSDDLRTPDKIERYKSSAGMEWVISTQVRLDSTLQYLSTCTSKKNVIADDPWQMRFDNELRIRIWRWFSFSMVANLNYDATQTKRLQFKESTQLGFLCTF